MKHEWNFDRMRGKNLNGTTPEHNQNVKVYLKDGRSLSAWYDISGWFRGMQGGFIYNVAFWESEDDMK